MAILRSFSGEFYEVPDKQLEKFLIPEDQVKEKLDEANMPLPSGAAEVPPPSGAYSGFAPVVVQFLTPPQGFGFCGPMTPAPQGGVSPYGVHIDWGGGHWGGHGGWGHGGHGGHWGGHGGHGGGHGGHGGGHGWGHGGHGWGHGGHHIW